MKKLKKTKKLEEKFKNIMKDLDSESFDEFKFEKFLNKLGEENKKYYIKIIIFKKF